MISHVILLFGFLLRPYLVRSTRQLNFVFDIDRICTTSYVVVLLGIHHRLHLVWLVTTVQYCFTSRTHLYDQSCHCLVCFSSQTTHSQIGPNSLVFIIDRIRFYQLQQLNFNFNVNRIYTISHVVFLSGFRHNQHSIQSIMKF